MSANSKKTSTYENPKDFQQTPSENLEKDMNEKNEVEAAPTVDLEVLKNQLEAKEAALEKWHRELSDKERNLEAESVAIHKRQVELDEREKADKEEIKKRIENEYLDARLNLSNEQATRRSEFTDELNKKITDFDVKNQTTLSNFVKKLEGMITKANAELDASRLRQEAELKKAREDQGNTLQKEREDQKKQLKEEREKALEQLKRDISVRTADLAKMEADFEAEKKRVAAENKRIVELEQDVEKREEDLKTQQAQLERDQRRLKSERSRIAEAQSDLDASINEKFSDTIKTKELRLHEKDKELDRLREQLGEAMGEVEQVTSFREVYGDDPQVIIQLRTELENQNKQLKDKLANAADRDEFNRISDAYRENKAEVERLSAENQKLNDSLVRLGEEEAKARRFESQYKSLQATCESLANQLEAKNQELVRLSTPEGRVADRDSRIAAIMTGSMDDAKDLKGAGEGFDSRYKKKDEITWLEDVWKKCKDYGIAFNKRILYAFHTALKINEWSTITVLAGVSGTGKSELPRLYAEFGGLNFCAVAVQPNWDSQESMLGFFNSIDNQFEPEELLKFLVQCTTDERYSNYMSVVLLDEMNLAHVEHYFAEFLSKLESRRGLSRKYLPEIEVKLGAGVKPYELKLARTLLWTGTMNQDETTKSLSDKVLDRGIVINFPRPKKLESRVKMGLITDYISDDRAKLHRETWQSWTSHEIEFSEEQQKEIENYRNIVQEINTALEGVGRALGHRVWQSIEYYIANYPTVREAMNYQPEKNAKDKIIWVPQNRELTGDLKAAMKIAFEDQIVQKIMPKLRGIETRDKRGKSSLDKIEDLLVSHDFASLQEDFQIAREQGYGQFIWNSAKYLDEKDEEESQEVQE